MKESREIRYSPALDGLRAICIILTLFNHVSGVPRVINGSVGVDVFFPLSGFLITGILLEKDWNDLKGYFIRRFFRIAPVYYFSLFCTVLLTLISYWFSVGESRMDQLSTVINPSLLFSRELASAPTLFGQAWTVGIEEKFYIGWPIIFLILRNNAARLVLLTAVLVIFSTIGNGEMFRGYGGIALGCIASILYFSYGFRIRTSYAVVLLAIAYTYTITSEAWFRNISVALGAAFLIPSIYATRSIVSRTLSLPLVVFVGRLTFSVYMMHVLVFFFVKLVLRHFGLEVWFVVFPVGYTCTLLVAWSLYHLYENPLINYGKRLAKSVRSHPENTFAS